ncbi:hypothetical protein Q8A67_017273 [Cirrhinus molitorella]|uniref:Uncharacterized protein n=1 Tax=Cirrhinus molitorella TaxID=172907 RepID=A0AA88PDT6_9TELE|nr:hypothetical protein Q8A67_017273 [Cirrhinus molitorella]
MAAAQSEADVSIGLEVSKAPSPERSWLDDWHLGAIPRLKKIRGRGGALGGLGPLAQRWICGPSFRRRGPSLSVRVAPAGEERHTFHQKVSHLPQHPQGGSLITLPPRKAVLQGSVSSGERFFQLPPGNGTARVRSLPLEVASPEGHPQAAHQRPASRGWFP